MSRGRLRRPWPVLSGVVAVVALGLGACSGHPRSADRGATDASIETSETSTTMAGGGADESVPPADSDAAELLRAAQTGSVAAVRELVTEGADPEDPLLVTVPVVAAARNGHGPVVDELLAAGASPDPRGDGGPLGAAAGAGHVQIVDRLLDAGADVDAVDSSGWSPLMWASYGGHTATVEQLLGAGADPAVRATGGGFVDASAQDIATELGHEGVVRLLSEG